MAPHFLSHPSRFATQQAINHINAQIRKDTIVHIAIQNDQLNTMADSIMTSHLETQGAGNKRPLLLAVELNQIESVKKLLTLGADVNALNDYQVNALMIAIQHGWFEMVQLLIDHGADIHLNSSDENMLHKAIRFCKEDEEAQKGYLAIIQVLIQQGIDVNCQSKSGISPLYLGVKAKNLEIVNLLLQAQADVNVKNRWGDTPLHVAARGGAIPPARETVFKALDNPAEQKIIREEKQGYNLFGAPFKPSENETAHCEILQELLSAQADINSQNHWRETPLHLAARYHRSHTLRRLVEKGAKINVEDNENHFPAYYCLNDPSNLAILKDSWIERVHQAQGISKEVIEIFAYFNMEQIEELTHYPSYTIFPLELWALIASFLYTDDFHQGSFENHPLGPFNQAYKDPGQLNSVFSTFFTELPQLKSIHQKEIQTEYVNSFVSAHKR